MPTTPGTTRRLFGFTSVTAEEYDRIVTKQAKRQRRIVCRTAAGPVVLVWDGDAYVVEQAS